MDRFEVVKEIGSGSFGFARLLRDKKTKELVAVKYIDRGSKIDKYVHREIINHRSLSHPNVVRFKKVCLTPSHLGIVMEYAAGGELLERICNAGGFSEDEARFFFQQLICGVSYCHDMQICHRDLKLENILLLDGSPTPKLKICDFGFSNSDLLHSQPKSSVGTPDYIAPEVLLRKEYDGKIADVWSCGVILYVMLVGEYPFEDSQDPRNLWETNSVSSDCQQLLSRIFIANPAKRITMREIKKLPWFLKNLPKELYEGSETGYNHNDPNEPLQSIYEIIRIVQEAMIPGVKIPNTSGYPDGLDFDVKANLDVETSGDFGWAV